MVLEELLGSQTITLGKSIGQLVIILGIIGGILATLRHYFVRNTVYGTRNEREARKRSGDDSLPRWIKAMHRDSKEKSRTNDPVDKSATAVENVTGAEEELALSELGHEEALEAGADEEATSIAESGQQDERLTQEELSVEDRIEALDSQLAQFSSPQEIDEHGKELMQRYEQQLLSQAEELMNVEEQRRTARTKM